MNSQSIISVTQRVLAAIVAIAVAVVTFALLEPLALTAQESVDITISQTITGETSFTSDPGNVNMDTSIASITGGTSNGTTTFTVQSNNGSGYNVTILFEDQPSMQQQAGASNIPNYIEDTPDEPDYGFGNESSGGSAQFGFSVFGASASIVASEFLDNSGGAANACSTGSDNAYAQCWSAGSTTARTILDRSSATTGGGDTSNVLFRVHVPANPSPAVPADTYVATATLTVSENP
ncbi:hypothetical protein CL655_01950 [bacterium]|nr:hypothetical protein [bacterium]|tara:strand:+ start:2849 stop:3556 length:708 start_codon:yes stop_codon:yes gene_type:complete